MTIPSTSDHNIKTQVLITKAACWFVATSLAWYPLGVVAFFKLFGVYLFPALSSFQIFTIWTIWGCSTVLACLIAWRHKSNSIKLGLSILALFGLMCLGCFSVMYPKLKYFESEWPNGVTKERYSYYLIDDELLYDDGAAPIKHGLYVKWKSNGQLDVQQEFWRGSSRER